MLLGGERASDAPFSVFCHRLTDPLITFDRHIRLFFLLQILIDLIMGYLLIYSLTRRGLLVPSKNHFFAMRGFIRDAP